MLFKNKEQRFFAGVSASCFLISILPILRLQQDVLQYGYNNNSMDWIKGGCMVISWACFTATGSIAFHLFMFHSNYPKVE